VEVVEHKAPLDLVGSIKENNKDIDVIMNEIEAILNEKEID
jgi:hypothetical protein